MVYFCFRLFSTLSYVVLCSLLNTTHSLPNLWFYISETSIAQLNFKSESFRGIKDMPTFCLVKWDVPPDKNVRVPPKCLAYYLSSLMVAFKGKYPVSFFLLTLFVFSFFLLHLLYHPLSHLLSLCL